MEHVKIDLCADAFDRIVHRGLPEGGDLEVAVKAGATVNGKAAVAIGFSVQLPDGSKAYAQVVTTAANFLGAAAAVRGYVERIGGGDHAGR